jgi:hypothetical protein
MAKSIRRARGRRSDVMEMWHTPKQWLPWMILGVLIRWRVELILGIVWVIAMIWLYHQVGELSAWLILTGVGVLVAVVPPARRFLLTRFWCVVDRHRVRTCLRTAKIRTMNLDGALPFLLWARPTRTGERVWMWTRVGSSADDVEAVLGCLAPACFARDARLRRVRSMSTLIAVEIIRRDPLSKPTPIASPLAKLSAPVHGQVAAAGGSEPITGATVIPMVPPRVPAEPAPASSARPRKTTSTTSASEPARPAVVVNGEDLSDYID